jgi:biotin carboxyl carrier protein
LSLQTGSVLSREPSFRQALPPVRHSFSSARYSSFPLKEAEKVKGGYISPMPGKVIKVLVEPGKEVKSGEGLLVLLSMKMENTICADEDGTVEDVYVNVEEDLEAGKLLLKMKK